MYGDRRPYPVALITLDPEQIIPWAAARSLPQDMPALVRSDEVIELIQSELDRVNARVRPGRADQEVRAAGPMTSRTRMAS